MGVHELEIALKISEQYLHPVHNPNSPGGVEAQVEAEKGTIHDVIAVLAKQDQDVLKIFRIVEKARNAAGD